MVRGQREKMQYGKTGDKRLEDEDGAALAEGEQIVQWKYTGRMSTRRGSQCCK